MWRDSYGEEEEDFSDGSRRTCWVPEEDIKLIQLVETYGPQNWSLISKSLGTGRNGKSCRLRWFNQLDPNLKKDPFSAEEEEIIIAKHEEIGNKWAAISKFLPGRTDNAIKNYWNGHLKKRVGTRASELAASKKLRTLAAFALEEDDQDEDLQEPIAKAQRIGSEASPRRATVATTTTPRSVSGAASPNSHRHVTRAATGSLRRKAFDDEEISEDDDFNGGSTRPAGTIGTLLPPLRIGSGGGNGGGSALQHAAAAAHGPGSNDSSQHTRSTADHCSDPGETGPAQDQHFSAGLDRTLSSVGSSGFQFYDPALFASFSTMMNTLFPSSEQQASMSDEQRVFLGHFHTAFGKLIAGQAAAAVGTSTGEHQHQQQQQPISSCIPNPASLFASVANAAGAAAAAAAEGVGGGGADGLGISDGTTPMRMVSTAAAEHLSVPDAAVVVAAAASELQSEEKALAIGQMMLSMAPMFPGLSAALSAMSRVSQGGNGGGAVFNTTHTPVPATAPPPTSPSAPASNTLPIAPLSAPQFVQTAFGEILAARVSGTHPKVALPFSSNAWTPAKGNGNSGGEGCDEMKNNGHAMALKTPISMQATRPASAARNPEGLAFLAMAASMEDE